MSDCFTKEKRSWVMSRVRARDTTPEMVVRSLVHRLGYRFRLHRKNLPGKPDLTFPSRRKIIFVNGCFWHRCPICLPSFPKTNQEFWKLKFEKNIKRDKLKITQLKKVKWKVLVIWECEINDDLNGSIKKIKYVLGTYESN